MPVTGYVYDEVFLEHGAPGHPECAERLLVIMRRLEESGLLGQMTRLPARAAEPEEITTLHTVEHVEDIRLISEQGGGSLDLDTIASAGTWRAAIAAVGSCLDAARAVHARQVDNALCLVRPPGHHARPDAAMGFCIFNNVALAAEALLRERARSVAIVDFDAHHGNGTQEMFYHRERVLYISLHQSPLYPGTGSEDEVGVGAGFGRTINIPLMVHAGDEHFLRAFEQVVLPVLDAYQPEAILVSAGFDGHFCDPISRAQLRLTANGYYDIMRLLVQAAAHLCQGRLTAVLEGGYDLEVGLPESAEATARALLGLPPLDWSQPQDAVHPTVREQVTATLDRVIALHRERWLT